MEFKLILKESEFLLERETWNEICSKMTNPTPFQTWEWNDENYKLIQYIINDQQEAQVSKFECEYRATRREELTNLFILFKNPFYFRKGLFFIILMYILNQL